MGKRKPREKKSTDMVQFAIRMPIDLAERLQQAAEKLATDRSHLLRIILAENLHEYEDRAAKARSREKENAR